MRPGPWPRSRQWCWPRPRLAGCGGRQDTPTADSGGEITCEVGADTRISIATGNATGVYFSLGNAYAEQISAATDGKVKATAAETGASVQNIQQLVGGNYQVAFSLADTAADAVEGKGSFDGEKQPVQALARIYPNYTQVIVRTGSGITSVADMRGKRVSTGSPGSGTEVIANRLLESAGLDPANGCRRAAPRPHQDRGRHEGRLDRRAVLVRRSAHAGDHRSAHHRAQRGGVPRHHPAAGQRWTRSARPTRRASIPAATYQLPADVKTIVVPNMLLVRDDLDANLACVLTKTLFDRQAAAGAGGRRGQGHQSADTRATPTRCR